MTLFEDSWFFVYLVITLIPALILGICEKPIKYYAFAVSLIFVWMATETNKRAMFFHIGFCIAEFIVLRVWLKVMKKYGRKSSFYVLFLALGMAPLVISKLSNHFMGFNLLGFMGISYMTFKILQMIIEIYDELIEEVPAFDYFSFLLFFPSVLSGPIDRSQRYTKDLNTIPQRSDYMEMAGTGLYKIITGLVYKFVCASLIYQILIWVNPQHGLMADLIYMYAYGFYLFFDFAGYSRMAIGTAYLFGVKTPENFNAPFKSKDIMDFWDRWHITLSHWFRDYLFSRLMMRWIKNKRFSSRLTAAACGFMINMTVMGLWHGLDIFYIMYGIYHGALLTLTEIWNKKSKFRKKHKKDKGYIAVSTFITFNLVMFGLFIFSGRFTEILGLTPPGSSAVTAVGGDYFLKVMTKVLH